MPLPEFFAPSGNSEYDSAFSILLLPCLILFLVARFIIKAHDLYKLRQAFASDRVIRVDALRNERITRGELNSYLNQRSLEIAQPIQKVELTMHCNKESCRVVLDDNSVFSLNMKIQASSSVQALLYMALKREALRDILVPVDDPSPVHQSGLLQRPQTKQGHQLLRTSSIDIELLQMRNGSDGNLFSPESYLARIPAETSSADAQSESELSVVFPGDRLLAYTEEALQSEGQPFSPLVLHLTSADALPQLLVGSGQFTRDSEVKALQNIKFDAQYVFQNGVWQEMQDIYGADEDEGADCIVCLTDPKEIVLLPCRHVCLCRTCHLKCDKCPICRSEITSFMQFAEFVPEVQNAHLGKEAEDYSQQDEYSDDYR